MTLSLQLAGHRLILAHITYHLPDFPALLQEFTWQTLDIAPKYPVLTRFIRFWEKNLDGAIHSVRVGSLDIVKPPSIRTVSHSFSLH